MKRLKVRWQNVDKTSAILYPILIAVGLSIIGFIFNGFTSPVSYIWSFWSFFVLFVLYGFALFLEPVFFIGKKKIFIPVWLLWGIIPSVSAYIWMLIEFQIVTGFILIGIIWILFILGMVRIKFG